MHALIEPKMSFKKILVSNLVFYGVYMMLNLNTRMFIVVNCNIIIDTVETQVDALTNI